MLSILVENQWEFNSLRMSRNIPLCRFLIRVDFSIMSKTLLHNMQINIGLSKFVYLVEVITLHIYARNIVVKTT